jgi:hypothetical protein
MLMHLGQLRRIVESIRKPVLIVHGASPGLPKAVCYQFCMLALVTLPPWWNMSGLVISGAELFSHSLIPSRGSNGPEVDVRPGDHGMAQVFAGARVVRICSNALPIVGN